MNRGQICAWHYASGQPIQLEWRDGLITGLGPASQPPNRNLWVAPPLVDLQINGYAGIDFQQDGLTGEQLLGAIHQLRLAGCGRFLLTLMTDQWPRLMARLRHLRALRLASEKARSAIAGWHIEGPFLSQTAGFHGAHNPAWMLDPRPEHLHELRDLVGRDPLMLTLAPERKGALETIQLAVSLGIKVSLGHTNASAEVLRQAVVAGATGFTHLGNGCPHDLDRHDNIVWRVLETPGLTVSLIPDGIHVSPALFRLLHRWLDPATMYYTTDAMAAADAPPGRYRLGPMELDVGADQIVRQPGKTNYAGSALRPLEGIRRAARMLNRPWPEVWRRFSEVPAQFMGLPAGLALGQEARFCLVEVAEDDQVLSVQVFPPEAAR